MPKRLSFVFAVIAAVAVLAKPVLRAAEKPNRPNIVFCMADDWSWPHASILGDPVVKTPHFDRVATEEDPDQLDNVATDQDYAKTKQRLRRQLDAELIKSLDPRLAVAGYQDRTILGWPVRISSQLAGDQHAATERAIELLTKQLRVITTLVSTDVLDRLCSLPIWMCPKYKGVRPIAEYHPNIGWLRKVGRRPELADCVELTNIDIFQKECRGMPMMVLHELAHAYHHQVLGFDHPRVKAAFDRAVASGSYDAVQRNNGKTERAYAMSNAKEYFAESSEAFFGTNDFYPFNRKQLKQHDPRMEQLLSVIWNPQASDAQETEE